MQRVFVFNLDHSTAMWCGGPCYPSNTSVTWFSLLNPDRSPRPAYTALQTLLGGPPPTANLKLSATSVVAGGGVTATWANSTAPTAADWLGLFPVGAPNTGWVERKYVSCSQVPGPALASGACQFRLGRTLRSYEVRMFS